MSTQSESDPADTAASATATADSPSTTTATSPASTADGVEVQTPEFQNFGNQNGSTKPHEINRFADIKVTVSAELGRTSIPIQKLLTLGGGSVLELERTIDSPIELIAQGIPLASGEVVVVDGCFAIRIIEVYPRNRRGEELKVDEKV